MLPSNSQLPRPGQKELQQEQPESEFESIRTASTRRSWWGHPVAGYICAIPIVSIAIGLTTLGEMLLVHNYFPSAFLLLSILSVTLVWGVGPGLFALALCCIALLVPSLPPPGLDFDFPSWQWAFHLLPFTLSGLVVTFIAGQREAARKRARQAEQIAKEQADNLARLNQQLRQADQLKDLFLSMATHELRTPITTIRGQTQLALRYLNQNKASPPDVKVLGEKFHKVEEQTTRLSDLLNKLLDLNSLRSGQLVLEPGLCNLNEICIQVVEEQRMLSKRTIDLTLPTSPILLTADANRLAQVFTNLVSNALKYSSSKGQVSVKVERDQQFARIRIHDTGRGISAEQMSKIFEPFYRTSEARASTIGGSGLGLTICKDIIEQHYGHIWCTSHPGCGSTFFVELPLTPLDC